MDKLESDSEDVVHGFLQVRTSVQAEEIDLGDKPPRDPDGMAPPEEDDVVVENDHGVDTCDKVHVREVLDASHTWTSDAPSVSMSP